MTKYVSPWYNHTGWLGVKHYATSLALCDTSRLMMIGEYEAEWTTKADARQLGSW